jgi:hypothetical protein
VMRKRDGDGWEIGTHSAIEVVSSWRSHLDLIVLLHVFPYTELNKFQNRISHCFATS